MSLSPRLLLGSHACSRQYMVLEAGEGSGVVGMDTVQVCVRVDGLGARMR